LEDEVEEEGKENWEEDGGGLVVPGGLLEKSLAAGEGRADPSKLSAAVHALRHALKGADSEGLALKIDDPRTGVNRANASYRARALPKRAFVENQHRRKDGGGTGKTNGEDSWNDGGHEGEGYGGGGEGMRAVTPGVVNAAIKAKSAGKNALHELEDMLADMEDRMEDIEREGGNDGRARTAGVASRSGDRAIGSLVGMVNNVVDEFT